MNPPMILTVALTSLNLALTLILVIRYGMLSWKIKASFPIALLVVSVLFALQNAAALSQYLTMMNYFAPGLEMYELVFAILQTAAFSTLTWLSLR